MAFPVAGVRHLVGLGEDFRVGLAQHLLDLVRGPDVELALLALAIGIERGGKAAALGDHLAQDPADRLVDAAGVEVLAGLAVGLAHQVEEEGVVVEHLLEVRHQPALVGRVAGKAAAEVVVDAALADVGERVVDGVPGGLVAVTDGAAPQQPEEAPLRELGRAGKPAVMRVDGGDHAPRQVGQERIVDGRAGARRVAGGKRLEQQLSVVADLVGFFGVDARHLFQDLGEAGPAVARGGRKIRAAPERARLAVEEHGQRPAALLAQIVQRAHVDGVDVGALLAVDLDVDEEVVHLRGDGRILEALVRHDVAPVAGRVADREQDRPAAALGLGQRLGAPGPPVHGVVLVLQQIGAGLAGEAVFGGRGGGHRAE